jgi:hypothetical protein
MKTSPGVDAAGELLPHLGHRVGDGAQVQRQREALGDEPALRVAEGAGHVHRVLEIVRVGRAHQRDRHLVDDGVERVLDQLEQDGIGEAPLGDGTAGARSAMAWHGRGLLGPQALVAITILP